MFTVKRLWILGASGGIFPTGVTMHTQAMAHEGTSQEPPLHVSSALY